MLEMLILYRIGQGLAHLARSKGRPAAWWVAGVGAWIFGEGFGLIAGLALGLPTGYAYIASMGCAAGGTLAVWIFVSRLPHLEAPMGDDVLSRVSAPSAPSGTPTPAQRS